MVRVILDNGEIEVLVTSLFDQAHYPSHEFKELYYRRWGIETFYSILKEKKGQANNLINSITKTQIELQQQALQTVNQALTVRNWLIGFYIVEYEQKGADRAKYGEALFASLAKELKSKKLKGFSATNLKLFRLFYQRYPQVSQVLKTQWYSGLTSLPSIRQTASDEFALISQGNKKPNEYSPKVELLCQHFSFSHFIELLKIDDPLKHAFYEIEGIKGNWSVRQLKRQIESLLFERTGLSTDKAGLLKGVHEQRSMLHMEDIIRDPYILEFTGLQEKAQYSENDLETALLDHIQEFLLELGNGFCFEARQKRITIDNEHDRVDLVFYHRILKCHVLIDLKIRKFSHGDAGQMNFYLNYFKENIQGEQDNDPIGLILCTDKSETKVQYVTAGMDQTLFVSKYLIALPTEEELGRFIEEDRERIDSRLSSAS